jgi:Flp pilus assembly protein TadB
MIAEAGRREKRGFTLFVAAMLLIVISIFMIVLLPPSPIPVAVVIMSALLALLQNYLVKHYGSEKKRLIEELANFAFENSMCPECGKQMPQRNLTVCPFCGSSLAPSREL